MKKLLNIFILSFSLGLLLVCVIAYANQTSISNYYPSPSGNYTKVHLVNKSGASIVCNGTNGGAMFVDPNTGYLEVCKSDGTFASYPGSCFTRLGASGTTPTCPTNYQVVSSTSPNFGSGGIVSWYCCFNGGGGTTTKAGCFSMYSNSPTQPYFCTDTAHGGDANAYDVGCDFITSSDMSSVNPVFKRNCCFNDSLGTSITATSTCSCPNTCGANNCGNDACGHSCGTCASGLTCSSPNGPGTCVCTPNCAGVTCGASTCGGSSECCNGTIVPGGEYCCENNGVFAICPTGVPCDSAGGCGTGSGYNGGSCTCPGTCGANTCSSDPCGNSCGTCPSGQSCSSTTPGVPGTCSCPNTCGTDNCSSDPCGHVCGSCTSPQTCSSSTAGIPGTCGCSTNTCGANNCSTDPCGNSCGNCASPQTCSSTTAGTPGTCTCPNTCGGFTCSTDPCGHSCGTCVSPITCSSTTPGQPGSCGCTPTICYPSEQCGTNVPGTNDCGQACTSSPSCTATCSYGPCPTLQSCNQGNCEWSYTAAAVVDTSGYVANGNVFVAGKVIIQTNTQSWQQCGLISPTAPVTSVTSFNCDNSAGTNIWWEAGDACPFVYNCSAPPADCVGYECSGTPGSLPGYDLCGGCNTASPITCTNPQICDAAWGSPYCCSPISSCPSCVDYSYGCGGVVCSQNCSGTCATSGDGSQSQCCNSNEEPCETTTQVTCCNIDFTYCDTSGGFPNCVSIP